MRDSFLQKFIKDTKKKYMGLIQKEASANDFGYNDLVTGKAKASGPTFTGRGPDMQQQDDAPAGVVHEGELVTSAAEVRNAGGPEVIQQTIQAMGREQTPQSAPQGVPDDGLEELPGYMRGGLVGLRKYQSGSEPGQTIESPRTMFNKEVTSPARTMNTTSPTQSPASLLQTPDTTQAPIKTFDSASDVIKKNPSQPITDPLAKPVEPTEPINPNLKSSRPTQPSVTPEDEQQPEPETYTLDNPDGTQQTFENKTDYLNAKLELGLENEANIDTDFEPLDPTAESARSQEYLDLENDAITKLQNIINGTDESSLRVQEIARLKLAGQLAAQGMASDQAAAQAGLTGGALSASRARQKREASLALTGLEGGLAEQQLARQDKAILDLMGLAERGKEFEEGKRQFMDSFNLDNARVDAVFAQLEANIAQHGTEIAFQMLDNQMNDQNAMFQALATISPAAAQAYSDANNLGIDISQAVDDEAAQTAGFAMAEFMENIGFEYSNRNDPPYSIQGADGEIYFDEGFKDSGTYASLVDAWNATNADRKVDPHNPSTEFTNWAAERMDNYYVSQDPAFALLNTMDINGKENFLGAVEIYNENDEPTGRFMTLDPNAPPEEQFTYKGLKGEAAFDSAYNYMIMAGLLNADGSVSDQEGAFEDIREIFQGKEIKEQNFLIQRTELFNEILNNPDVTSLNSLSASQKEMLGITEETKPLTKEEALIKVKLGIGTDIQHQDPNAFVLEHGTTADTEAWIAENGKYVELEGRMYELSPSEFLNMVIGSGGANPMVGLKDENGIEFHKVSQVSGKETIGAFAEEGLLFVDPAKVGRNEQPWRWSVVPTEDGKYRLHSGMELNAEQLKLVQKEVNSLRNAPYIQNTTEMNEFIYDIIGDNSEPTLNKYADEQFIPTMVVDNYDGTVSVYGTDTAGTSIPSPWVTDKIE